jgi:hypothetical protein
MMKKTLLSMCLLVVSFWATAQNAAKPKTVITHERNPEQQLPLTIGLQKHLVSNWGLRVGTDYTYAHKSKTKEPKKLGGRVKQIDLTQHIGVNLQLNHAPTSYNTFIAEAEHFIRKTKTRGFLSQIGYGIGVQRNQYIGDRDAASVSGRTYLVYSLSGGLGVDLAKRGGKGSIQFNIHKYWLLNAFQKAGTNATFELAYRLPLFSL